MRLRYSDSHIVAMQGCCYLGAKDEFFSLWKHILLSLLIMNLDVNVLYNVFIHHNRNSQYSFQWCVFRHPISLSSSLSFLSSQLFPAREGFQATLEL